MITYVVKARPSKTQKWYVVGRTETMDDAIDLAKLAWYSHLDANTYVDVKIERIFR